MSADPLDEMKAAILAAVRASEPDGIVFGDLRNRVNLGRSALTSAIEALEEEGRVRWNKWGGWKLRLTACQRDLDVEAGI